MVVGGMVGVRRLGFGETFWEDLSLDLILSFGVDEEVS